MAQMHFTICWRLAVFASCLVGLLPRGRSSSIQDPYPACPNNWPGYEKFCCQNQDGTTDVFHKYPLDPPPQAVETIKDGWLVERQVNYPFAEYTPDTPKFVYKADSVCVLVGLGTNDTDVTLECAVGEPIPGKEDSNVFWTFEDNPRNNNVTCTGELVPITSQQQEDDCAAGSAANAQAGDTQTEFFIENILSVPMLAMYVIAALAAVTYPLWGLMKGASLPSLQSDEKKGDLEKGLFSGRQSIGTPSSTGRPSVTRASYRSFDQAQATEDPADDILQFGANNSVLGTLMYYYMSSVAIFLAAVVIWMIMDHYQVFGTKYIALDQELLVFIVGWTIATVYILTYIVMADGLRQYYRAPAPTSDCSYVEVIKPEAEAYALADRTPVTRWIRSCESMFRFSSKPSGYTDVFPVHSTSEGVRYFEFQCLRYVYTDSMQRFLPSAIDMGETFDEIGAAAEGLRSKDAVARLEQCGHNAVDIRMPSIWESVTDEFLTFFYLYQMVFYATYYYWDYWQVAGPMTVIILLSGSVNVVSKRSMQADIIRMARMEGDSIVRRDDRWVTQSLRELVPGDVIKVRKDEVLPCDVVILKGSPVMDESMLTGESTPVQKSELPYKAERHRKYEPLGASKKYTLFAGTRVMSISADSEEPRTRKEGEEEYVLGLVYTTGVNTARGQLVQNILFPIKMRFKFDDHMKIILAVLVVLSVLFIIGTLALLLSKDTVSNKLSFFLYAVNVIGEMIHPLLTVVVTVGQLRAAARLKKKSISCINPPRIALGGKVRVFCFDKTGTLTKEGLDVIGCVAVPERGGQRVSHSILPVSKAPKTIMRALATAQNVGMVNGKMVGNEVEVKMFSATGWKVKELKRHLGGSKIDEGQAQGQTKHVGVFDPNSGEVLEIFKRFEFDHKRMTMSVVVRDDEGEAFVFAKGSYEKIAEISTDESVPDDFLDVAEDLARDGAYVLGLAVKRLGKKSIEELRQLCESRDKVEENLDALGMLVFRNELKEDTREAIQKLKEGAVRPVMITGDNALCGCYIAKKCGMVDAGVTVYLGDSDPGKGNPIYWSNAETGDTVQEADVKKHLADNAETVELALTGPAFDNLVATDGIAPILMKTRIFARMTPDGKVKVVQLLMERGLCVGMCGDGGNDCGALRAAHVGVAFSNAEASVVSPFTSGSRSVASIVQLLCEGRCSAVTSFKAVAFILAYGQGLIFKRFLIDYRFNVFSPVRISVVGNAVIVPMFSYAVTLARPLRSLSSRRPSFSLIGPSFLASLLGQNVLTVLLLQSMVWLLFQEPWFCRFDPTGIDGQKWYLLTASYEATLCGLVYLIIAMSLGWPLSLGSRFRQPVWKNWVLSVFNIITVGFMLIILYFFPNSSFSDFFGAATSTNVMGLPQIPMPKSYALFWSLSPFIWIVVRSMYEWLVVNGGVADILRSKFHKELVVVKV